MPPAYRSRAPPGARVRPTAVGSTGRDAHGPAARRASARGSSLPEPLRRCPGRRERSGLGAHVLDRRWRRLAPAQLERDGRRRRRRAKQRRARRGLPSSGQQRTDRRDVDHHANVRARAAPPESDLRWSLRRDYDLHRVIVHVRLPASGRQCRPWMMRPHFSFPSLPHASRAPAPRRSPARRSHRPSASRVEPKRQVPVEGSARLLTDASVSPGPSGAPSSSMQPMSPVSPDWSPRGCGIACAKRASSLPPASTTTGSLPHETARARASLESATAAEQACADSE
jgi:hypothetical protein